MYLGIDLGTSNSAIVGNIGSQLRLFKTPERTDVLPSAIMMDRRGGMLVGRRAYEQAAFSPENVAQGFKRLMGSASMVSFSSTEMKVSPEQASAEIIKALVSQARMAMGDFEPAGTVVTIPAAFNQLQSEATMRSASLAGVSSVALLQEPIAAALSAISQLTNKSGQFLIYDLGGGTFDAAIVQSIGGAATVVAHSGINMLGGRDFDRAMLNSLVRPWLLERFSLPPDFQSIPAYQRLARVALFRCEIAKIALSTQGADRIFADEMQINAKDKLGKEIYLDVEVTRKELESLVIDDLRRTIEHCNTLLSDNGYKPDDIDSIILIGGPSRMPIVREKIAAELGIKLDLTTDPMTAVAFGAAIYSEGRDWKGSSSTAKSVRATRNAEGSLDIKYDFPARSSDNRVRVRVRASKMTASRGFQVVVDTEDGWTSGQVALQETT